LTALSNESSFHQTRKASSTVFNGRRVVHHLGRPRGLAEAVQVDRNGTAPWPQVSDMGRPSGTVAGEAVDKQHGNATGGALPGGPIAPRHWG